MCAAIRRDETVTIAADGESLSADLTVPADPQGLVLFAHGSGSGRFSPRNRRIAQWLQDGGLATLMLDLLTEREESVDRSTAEYRFDIPRLAQRLVAATDWAADHETIADLPVGYFGASTGAAAALIAAAQRPGEVRAVVSRGGRPDMADEALTGVQAPTLLIVGGDDPQVIELNRSALQELGCVKRLEIVPGATHLFEEPGALERVGMLARAWFAEHFGASSQPRGDESGSV